ncbi:MAG TPA: nicotinamide-nucleotide amidohydrolase family protein [Methylibium sp.]|uniref:CinA family protein n=1 Tax=Methylibium sp. TaxID=2067992 RepID=UPI002DBF7C47|nr:nicotinamide-nucleotide amidohydrolase family protein [Methylibium sp.]HEU4460404.1 nicotinamide-nucleotide amidohydrolase family protein [Methylibium sp.]
MHDALVARLAARMTARGWRLATAESCTGGLVAAACTALAGSSDWFERGFVSYSNAAKTELLGVPAALIAQHGAVSEAVARAMAEGARGRAGVELAVAITGVAGPGGGSAAKPVGTVWIAVARSGGATHAESRLWPGDREAVRRAATGRALELLLDAAA